MRMLKGQRTDRFILTGWRCIMVKRPWRWQTRRMCDLCGLGLTFLQVEANLILKGTEVDIESMQVCWWEFEDSITIHISYICIYIYTYTYLYIHIYIYIYIGWVSQSQHPYGFMRFESCQPAHGVNHFFQLATESQEPRKAAVDYQLIYTYIEYVYCIYIHMYMYKLYIWNRILVQPQDF